MGVLGVMEFGFGILQNHGIQSCHGADFGGFVGLLWLLWDFLF
jgi:hypothetical protein